MARRISKGFTSAAGHNATRTAVITGVTGRRLRIFAINASKRTGVGAKQVAFFFTTETPARLQQNLVDPNGTATPLAKDMGEDYWLGPAGASFEYQQVDGGAGGTADIEISVDYDWE